MIACFHSVIVGWVAHGLVVQGFFLKRRGLRGILKVSVLCAFLGS